MRHGTPRHVTDPVTSRCVAYWRDSFVSHAKLCGATMPATSAATFPNVTVYISRVTSCDVTQLLVVPRSLARPKVLLLGNLVGEELLLKNEIKKS
jgi:hypothetical protein